MAGRSGCSMAYNLNDPQAIATRGEEIYKKKYKAQYEARYRGKFVAIDVKTEAAYLGDTAEAALEDAKRAASDGVFHLIRVGEAGAFRVSRTANAQSDWIFR